MGIFRRRSDRRDDRNAVGPGNGGGPSHEFLELNPAELAWHDTLRGTLPDGGALAPEAIGSLYDEACLVWNTAPSSSRDDPNILVNALAIALGDAVCARVPDARWGLLADAGGTHLAVAARPPDGPMVFPTSAVATRWSSSELGWVPGFVDAAVAGLGGPTSDAMVQVRGLASFALGHAVHSIVPEGGPLIPFSLLETAEGRSLDRFVGELSEGLARARAHVRVSGAVRAAVAWDGYLTTDGRREDALFAEASNAGQPSLLVAHRYVQTRDGARALGGPLVVGRGAALL